MNFPCSEFLAALQLGHLAQGGWQDGCVVDLRSVADKTVILVGDLHAKFRRIDDILAHAQLEPLLQQETAVLVFLGDLFHREEDERAGEMESSLQTLRRVMELKIRYPRSVYMLLGNHEFTRTDSTKRGHFQGELFRLALEDRGLAQCYDAFLRASPMLVIHPRCVGVHAGPALSVNSLDELRKLTVRDVPPGEMPAAVRELAFSRHRDWSPNPRKHYDDHDVQGFLRLCDTLEGRLITGHTPLDRQTDWNWDIGRHLTVIFAAGREVGYLKLLGESMDLVRVGRSERDNDEVLLADRTPQNLLPETGLVREKINGRPGLRVTDLVAGVELKPDAIYRFEYANRPLTITRPDGETFALCQYRHLSASAQAYYAQGTYLIGHEFRQEVLRLKTDLAVLLGGDELVEGVRFSWGSQEFAILRQNQEGEFELRALIPGLTLS